MHPIFAQILEPHMPSRDVRVAFDEWYSNQFNATAPRIIEQTDHASDFWQCWLAAIANAAGQPGT